MILAVVAEDEARRKTYRTKAALAADETRGGVIGHASTFLPKSRECGAAASIGKRLVLKGHALEDVAAQMRELRPARGSLRAIDESLNRAVDNKMPATVECNPRYLVHMGG